MEPEPQALKQQFTDLYERHYGSIYAFAARRVGRQSADEIAAETFLIAWRRFASLPAAPLPWLYGTARNVLARQRDAAARDGRTLDAIAGELAVGGRPSPDSGGDRRLADAWHADLLLVMSERGCAHSGMAQRLLESSPRPVLAISDSGDGPV